MSISLTGIFRWFHGLSLRTKLIGGFAAIVGLLVLVGIFATLSQMRLWANVNQVMKMGPGIAKLVTESNIALLEARRTEKDFLLQGREIGFREAKARYAPLLRMHLADVRENMSAIRTLAHDDDVNRLTREIEQALNRYENGFLAVVDLFDRLGHVDTGIEGQFRTTAHEMEGMIRENHRDRLLIDVLALRRHEKDYLLRGGATYVAHFTEAISQFKSDLSQAKLVPEVEGKLTVLANQYQAAFEQYVSTRAEIRDATEAFRIAAHSVEPLQRQLLEWVERRLFAAHESVRHFAAQTIWTGAVGACAAMLVGMLVAFFASREIERGVRASLAFAQQIAQGDFRARIRVKGADEFSALGRALNDMADALQQANLKMEEQQTELTRLNAALRQEITRCTSAERVASVSANRLRSVLETANDAIISVDSLGRVVLWNPAATRAFGYAPEEILNQPVTRLMPERHVAAHELGFRKAVSQGTQQGPRELAALRADGTEFPIELTLSHWASGDGTFFTAIVRDVTDRKSAEKEQADLKNQLFRAQKMEALATLVGAIAHDFNNLLTVILGYAELLQGNKNQAEQDYQDLEKIGETARKGAEVVHSLLTLSRQTDLSPLPLNLNRQMEHIHKLLLRTLPKMITIETRLADDLAMIHADPGRIDQVVMNLAINAMEAMPEGGKFIIETRNVQLVQEYCASHVGVKPGRHVMLALTDSGHGMDEKTLARIFDPFFTTKQRDSRKGTGLGLSVAQGIVEQHGGHIVCESRVGHGATFKIYFPALEQTEGRVEMRNERSSWETPVGTILLVDDEELIRGLGERILTKAGYRVLTASNGRQALELYIKQQGDISLVILDLIMPEMSGYQCLAEFLKLNPDLSVIVSSGYSDEGGIRETLEKGAKAFVKKPYDIDQLLKAVQECAAT